MKFDETSGVYHLCLIAGACYPNYFMRKSINTEDRERKVFHELNGRDPCNTIYYRTGLEANQCPLIYQDQVKRYMVENKVVSSIDEVRVSTDDGASKIFVTFVSKQRLVETLDDEIKECSKTEWMPGRVKIEIYKAIKLSRETCKLKLHTIKEDDNIQNYPEYNEMQNAQNFDESLIDLCVLPADIYLSEIIGNVLAIVHPNKFWFRPMDSLNILNLIEETLNSYSIPILDSKKAQVGQIVAVKFKTETDMIEKFRERFHRAKITSITMTPDLKYTFKLSLIDDGGEITISSENKIGSLEKLEVATDRIGVKTCLRQRVLLREIPPRVFECSLAEVQPSLLKSSTGRWTYDAIDIFKEHLQDSTCISASIYSVWNGIVSVDILNQKKQSLSKKLIDLQLGQRCEENYSSKQDHARRYKAQKFGNRLERELNTCIISNEINDYLKKFYENPIRALPKRYLTRIILMRGPFSPLETTVHATTRIGKFASIQ